MRKHNQGFTIIEIIFAFVLLAIGLTEGAMLLSKGAYNNSITGKNVVALTLAKQRMEIIKNQSYATVSSGGNIFPAPYVDYWYQVIVTPLWVPPGQIQIKDVMVIVSSSSTVQAVKTSVSLETYVGNY